MRWQSWLGCQKTGGILFTAQNSLPRLIEIYNKILCLKLIHSKKISTLFI